jgi:hypothetical protein
VEIIFGIILNLKIALAFVFVKSFKFQVSGFPTKRINLKPET